MTGIHLLGPVGMVCDEVEESSQRNFNSREMVHDQTEEDEGEVESESKSEFTPPNKRIRISQQEENADSQIDAIKTIIVIK